VTFIVFCTINTQLTLFTILVSKAGRTGVTFLTVRIIITGHQTSTTLLTGSVIFQVTNQTDSATLTTYISAFKASETQFTEFFIRATGITVNTVSFCGTLPTQSTVRAPFLNTVMTLKAAFTVISG